SNDLSAAGVRRLLTSPLAGRLTHLGLNDCRIDDGVLEAIANAPALSHLRALGLQGDSREWERGLRALAFSPYLPARGGVSLLYPPAEKDIAEAFRTRFPADTWAYRQFSPDWEELV